MKSGASNGFSLVEVVIALGLFAFVLVVMLALLPTGIKSNKASIEDTTAAGILTMLEADLRNTHPSLNGGKSQIFGLPLPYVASSGTYTINTGLAVNTLSSTYTTGVGNDGSPVAVTTLPPPHYQATVIYTRVPAIATPGSLAPVEARLIVNWPCLNTSTVSDLTSPGKTAGFLDVYVAFPAP